MLTHARSLLCCLALLGLALGACAKDTPEATPLDSGSKDQNAVTDHDRGVLGDAVVDAGSCPDPWPLADVAGNNASCQPLATDYQPNSATDGWDACISDDNTYHPFDSNISSIARVAGFEQIVTLLLKSEPPTGTDFLDARLAYSVAEGLESRVSRREDEHYPKAAKACADMDATELAENADRCVGPARIQPLLNQAFAAGASSQDPLVNAARIEAGLLWFFYVSVHKESLTCTTTAKDCDSSQAYYNGGDARSGGKGLARYVRSLSTQAHDRIWDGILAVRCWRDLDGGKEAVPVTATNLALRDKAMAQLDRALLRGMALLVKSRAKRLSETTCPDKRAALWVSLQILGDVLDREATVRDAAQAKALRDALALTTPTAAALEAITTSVQALFPCP